MSAVSLTVNGKAVTADIDPRTLLVQYLRENLRLTGTHVGCDTAQCGACTVHLDGVAMRACLLRASDVEGRRVTTIEGLSADGDHPVQRAWLEERVAQCGWCQPGQIMQAAAFLAETPAPSPEDIAAAMDANLCRCGTGPRILRAVARAAGMAGEATR
mgnify:CR=1 FL=1